MRYTPSIVTYLAPYEVFVFGSNIAGLHEDGDAYRALRWGAQMQQCEGHYGQTYAIPVRNKDGILPIGELAAAIDRFVTYALSRPELVFVVSELMYGVVPVPVRDIAPLFRTVQVSEQFHLPYSFHLILNERV